MYAKLPSVASKAVSEGSLRRDALDFIFETPKSRMRVRSSCSPGGDLVGRELALLDEEVRGLDVAMDDVCVVRGAQALERVLDDRRDLGEGEVLLAAEPLVEPLADEALERDPEPAVLLLAGAQDGRDEGRLDLLGDVRFAIEARDEVRVLGGPLVEDLEGDLLAASALRSVHLAHPTLADQPADLVDPADYRSWRQARLGCHIPASVARPSWPATSPACTEATFAVLPEFRRSDRLNGAPTPSTLVPPCQAHRGLAGSIAWLASSRGAVS